VARNDVETDLNKTDKYANKSICLHTTAKNLAHYITSHKQK